MIKFANNRFFWSTFLWPQNMVNSGFQDSPAAVGLISAHTPLPPCQPSTASPTPSTHLPVIQLVHPRVVQLGSSRRSPVGPVPSKSRWSSYVGKLAPH